MALLGNVSDMINRIRDNEALRKARHERFRKIKDNYSENIQRETTIQDHETAVKNLNNFREGLKLKLINEKRKSAFKISLKIFVVLLIIIFLYLLIIER
jgi:ribosomal protein S8